MVSFKNSFTYKNIIIRTLIFLSLIIILIFFYTRGVVFYDEGYILNSALRIAHGQIPYRDFDAAYPPFSIIYTAFFLKLFGESVLSGKIAALLITLFSLYAIYKVLRLFKVNFILIYISMLYFIGWGPAHVNFPSPTMFAVCFLFYIILFYLLGIKNKEKKYFYLTGIMVVLGFLSKQNFGAGLFLAIIITFIFTHITNKKAYFLSFLLGVITTTLLFTIILFLTSSFIPFIDNFYIYTIKRIVLEKTLETPFLYEGPIYIRIVKFFIYIIPFIFSLIIFINFYKTNKNYLIIPILTAFFYLIGIRPETDYIHLVPLLAASCIAFVLFILVTKDYNFKFVLILFLILFTGVAYYKAYYGGYYKWGPPLKDHTYFSINPRINVFLTEADKIELEQLVKYIQNNTRLNEKIFVNYYAPLVYFISDRENISNYDLIGPNQLPIANQKLILSKLKRQNTKLVIMHDLNKNENSIIANYVYKNYKIKKLIYSFIVYKME